MKTVFRKFPQEKQAFINPEDTTTTPFAAREPYTAVAAASLRIVIEAIRFMSIS